MAFPIALPSLRRWLHWASEMGVTCRPLGQLHDRRPQRNTPGLMETHDDIGDPLRFLCVFLKYCTKSVN
jgi:hypothetical protein